MSEVVAVLGLGEAGSRYASDLLAEGVAVVGYDPAFRAWPPAAARRGDPRSADDRRSAEEPAPLLAASPEDAARGADVVLSLNSSNVAEQVARDAKPGLREGTVFADLNTASPEAKRRIAHALDGTGALFTDVAVLAPVPRAGLKTPLTLSGPGRGRLARFLEQFGVPVEDAGPEPGAAAGRKLLRSVFMKGLAAVVLESLDIAAHTGLEEWMRRQIVAELTAADEALVTRLVEGTRKHAARRLDEMRAAAEFAAELGATGHVVGAVITRLEELAAE
jgi:3-hydroxyisobutyrate dehydrogenase-like beta-hydroxyacid dehydrogenase